MQPPALPAYESSPLTQRSPTLKARWDLVPFAGLTEVVKVMTLACPKHGDEKWRTIPISSHLAATLRHLSKWAMGFRTDPDSGCSHLAHAGARVLFMIELEVLKARPCGDGPESEPEA